MPAFHTYILKIAGRCNINCSYCYMFKLLDQSWTKQPNLMARETWQTAAKQIRAHLEAEPVPEITILLHGGEPLLLGKQRMIQLLGDLQSVLDDAESPVRYIIQTNGTLLDAEWIDIFSYFGVGVGLSFDGLPASHDARRVDHLGRGTYARVRHALTLMQSSTVGRELFGGVFSVIDVDSDPAAQLQHMLDLGITTWRVELPDSNHVTPPVGRTHLADTRYGDWLIDLWDAYRQIGNASIDILPLSQLERLIRTPDPAEHPSGLELASVVVEANGEIHAADFLKVSTETALGLNVVDHTFAQTAGHPLIRLQMAGYDALSATCKTCPLLQICRGGQVQHRFSQQRGFDNPSVYCADMVKLIEHMQRHMASETAGVEALAMVA